MATVWGLATKASWTPVFDYLLFVCLFVVIVCCNATSDQTGGELLFLYINLASNYFIQNLGLLILLFFSNSVHILTSFMIILI